jgi:hypothetical protein
LKSGKGSENWFKGIEEIEGIEGIEGIDVIEGIDSFLYKILNPIVEGCDTPGKHRLGIVAFAVLSHYTFHKVFAEEGKI